jgi:hypothetical protein
MENVALKEAAKRRVAILSGLVLATTIAGVACGTSSTAPSGPCAADEQTAALFYGPPLGVTSSGDTTTYTWGAEKVYFIAQGSTCLEEPAS